MRVSFLRLGRRKGSAIGSRKFFLLSHPVGPFSPHSHSPRPQLPPTLAVAASPAWRRPPRLRARLSSPRPCAASPPFKGHHRPRLLRPLPSVRRRRTTRAPLEATACLRCWVLQSSLHRLWATATRSSSSQAAAPPSMGHRRLHLLRPLCSTLQSTLMQDARFCIWH
jgi:hypothetical protein